MKKAKVLVTGAGGAAAVSFIRATMISGFEFFAADVDPNASGLYLVRESNRFIVPPGNSEEFVASLIRICKKHKIDVLVPTVDSELIPLSVAIDEFSKIGTKLLLASEKTLRICLDKYKLMKHCKDQIPLAKFGVIDETFLNYDWNTPLVVKPRQGSGSRGVRQVNSLLELAEVPRNGEYIAQDYLPGTEYSVDVLAGIDGKLKAAVPRIRLKVDSGVAVAAQTVIDEGLQNLAKKVASLIGLSFVANVQFRRDAFGKPKLLEVNPRFPGTMALTVEAGINMPLLSLYELLGKRVEVIGKFKEIAMVRYWNEHFLDVRELQKLKQKDELDYQNNLGLTGTK